LILRKRTNVDSEATKLVLSPTIWAHILRKRALKIEARVKPSEGCGLERVFCALSELLLPRYFLCPSRHADEENETDEAQEYGWLALKRGHRVERNGAKTKQRHTHLGLLPAKVFSTDHLYRVIAKVHGFMNLEETMQKRRSRHFIGLLGLGYRCIAMEARSWLH
jgi:hypothetical protein